MEHERIGSWMQTYTGRKFFPLDPRAKDIDILDIARALAMTCRYGGHAKNFYSVAEHSVLMSQNVAPENAFWALMHDAGEAYVGDMVRPLKQNMPEFTVAEHIIMESIKIKFGLDPFYPDEVHLADNRILLDEKAVLMPNPPEPWFQEGRYEPLGIKIECWPWFRAEYLFLQRFKELASHD